MVNLNSNWNAMQSNQLKQQIHLKTMADIGGEKQKKSVGSAKCMMIGVAACFILLVLALILLLLM